MNNEKRTELCLHTNMGDGLNSIVEYLDDYASEYIRAIAVTDLNSVQAYQRQLYAGLYALHTAYTNRTIGSRTDAGYGFVCADCGKRCPI